MASELKLQLSQETVGEHGCGGHEEGLEQKHERASHAIATPITPTKVQAKNLKVVLCTIPLDLGRDRGGGEYPRMPKVAILSIYKWLRDAKYKPSFYDIDTLLPLDEDISRYFKEKQPDVVGVSAVVSSSYSQVKRISKIIRGACPSAKIVLGGYMAVSAPVILKKTNVDICVLGDGEGPLTAFCDYLAGNGKTIARKELSKIRGLAFLDDAGELEITGYGESKVKNEYYLPDYDILTEGCLGDHELMKKAYFRETKKCAEFNRDPRIYEPHRKPMMTIVLSTKGCVARCTFCQRFSQGYWIGNLEAFDRYLVNVKEKYNVGAIVIGDENFGSDKEYAYAVARLMKKHDLLWFAGGVRVTSVTTDDIKFFRDHGCVAIKYGVETGSQKILEIMEKRITVRNLVNALKGAKEAGLYSSLGFCLGMPGETNETIMETGRFIGEIARMRGIPPKNIFMDFPYAMPFPGTPLYQYAQLRGIIGTSVDEEERYLLWVSDKYPIKGEYVNLSGASMRDALFWDLLARYEAMRVYYSKPLEEGVTITSPTIAGTNVERHATVRTAITNLKFKNLIRYLSSPMTTLNEILVCTRLATMFPRSLFYGLMRNLIYVEYKIKNFIGGDKGFSRKKIEVIKEIEEGKGLRTVIQKLKGALPKPQTKTEKNVEALLYGR